MEDRREARQCRRRADIRHVRQYYQAGGACCQCPNRPAIEGTLDQICSQVDGNQSIGDFQRTTMQALHIGDAATPVRAR